MEGSEIQKILITLLVIGVIAFVSIRIFFQTSTTLAPSSTTSAAGMAAANFTKGIWDAIYLLSNVPYLIGALGLLAVVVLFGYYAGGGKIR